MSLMKRSTARPILARFLLSIVAAFALAGCGSAQRPTERGIEVAIRQERIENRIAPLTIGSTTISSVSLPELMRLLAVPGMSIAVIDHFEIVWAKGYGVARAESSTPVTPETLFQAGSVSKPVAAAGALCLVEAGTLSLDEDVNRRLTSWKVPESTFTSREKVTLRRILTHTAGTSGHGFPGYAVDAPRPTLVQVLKGESPANTPPVVVTSVPGSSWHYSGGGVCIEQLLMTDVTGQAFPEILRQRVFDPIGMSSSTFEQPLPAARAARAASGTCANGKEVPGRWHVYPEMAPGGLWTTPSDLARFGIEIARSAQGHANHVLSQTMAEQMLSPQFPRVGEPTWGDSKNPDRMGLGFFVGDASRPARFGHIGDDEGFAAIFIMFGDTGQGAVIMVNSARGIALADLVLANIAREYDWRFTPPGYAGLVATLYVVLAVPFALVLATLLSLLYPFSRFRYAWIAWVLACMLTLFAHVVPLLLHLWSLWVFHPLRGPFGGVLLLMPVTIALVVLAPVWKRRWHSPNFVATS